MCILHKRGVKEHLYEVICFVSLNPSYSSSSFFFVAVTTRKLHGGRYEQGKRMFYHENGTGAAVGVASVVRERLGHDTGHK